MLPCSAEDRLADLVWMNGVLIGQNGRSRTHIHMCIPGLILSRLFVLSIISHHDLIDVFGVRTTVRMKMTPSAAQTFGKPQVLVTLLMAPSLHDIAY